MQFIGDFHIHSHFSLATSKNLVPVYLDYWARLKGIKVVGTGDFTHPGWLEELKEYLEPAEQGLFRLKDEFKNNPELQFARTRQNDVRFMLTAEISNIYKKHNKTRKVHNLIFAPDFETAENIQRKLQSLNFNITSDGRPILGFDSRNLLELALEVNPDIFFVPAHIWTPWFSVLGAKSGFDSIEECFEDLSGHIYALETGLSSDPAMNWMCSILDRYTLISNSDAHSPEKLGREANLFDTELAYDSIIGAMKTGDPGQFKGTIEFFPQEGKYYYAGHRKCGVCWDPVEAIKHNDTCPVCGRKVTEGVMNRIIELSDREKIEERVNRHSFNSIIPLKEVLSEIFNVSPNSKKVNKAYHSIIQKGGSEFDLLLNLPFDHVKQAGGEILEEAVRRMRNSEVYINAGYDGEYGVIKVFKEGEAKSFNQSNALFNDVTEEYEKRPKRKLLDFNLAEYRNLEADRQKGLLNVKENLQRTKEKFGLNAEQQKAVDHFEGPAIIIAGPGSGKTRVLTERIINLIEKRKVPPQNILAVTFTNKAAQEIRGRIEKLLEHKMVTELPVISTFHSLGLSILKENLTEDLQIIDDRDKQYILKEKVNLDAKDIKKNIQRIAQVKQTLDLIEEQDLEFRRIFEQYRQVLQTNKLLDMEDLVWQTILLFGKSPEVLKKYRELFRFILVDEYQDVNAGQYELIRLLTGGEIANLCVIGDPNQAIYGFRGADVRYIQQFMDDYPEAKQYRLTKSYRCTDRILKASDNIIHSSEDNGFIEGLQQGIKIKIASNSSDKSEAEYIARIIEGIFGGMRFYSIDSKVTNGDSDTEINSLSDIAVLCRTKGQMPAIEEALNNHGIPYKVIGTDSVFKQEPLKLIIDLVTALYSEQNFFKTHICESLDVSELYFDDLKKRLAPFRKPDEVLETIISSVFSKEAEDNQLLFQQLIDYAKNKDDIRDFVQKIRLNVGADEYNKNIEAVNIMTIHASKGLEFECVFIAGCENGILPYTLHRPDCNREEEKRLLYVGMTRAKKYLYLSHAQRRVIRGVAHQFERSSFLDNIEKELIELKKAEYKSKDVQDDKQLSLF